MSNNRKRLGRVYVGNKYRGDTGINIMRGTPLGNPFLISYFNTREECIDKYQGWLRAQYIDKTPAYDMLMELVTQVEAGKDITLVCCCKPKACHGDVIKDAIEKIVAQALFCQRK
jgi:hypothetical protein